MKQTAAAIDIGTNTLLLLVVQATNGEVSILADECSFGRLGKGLDASGVLAEDSMARSLEIARSYRATLDELGVDKVACVGTQALREARNAPLFVAPAQDILGTPIQTIPGEREAEIVYIAVARQFPDLARGELIIADVGGGSTELIVASGGEVQSFTSLPIGSVRMTERHLKSDPPSPEETRALIADIDATLESLELPTTATVVGTAGTATTMAAVDLKLRSFSRDAVHGHRMTASEVDRQLATLLEMSVAQRKHVSGIDAPRADVIAGGAAIFARILHRVAAEQFTIADCGVRWGLVYELLES